MSLDALVRVTVGDLRLDVALHVTAGETLAVLGQNGAGKTTLLRALAGLLPLDAGRVVLDGVTLEDGERDVAVPPERRPIGMLFQQYLLFPHLSVLENVAYGPRARGVPARDALATARGWLERMGIASLAAARPATLSGGEAQRTALARALATSPRLLLLDEPLAALDVTTRSQVRRDLRAHLARFDGIRLLVTHDPVDALTLADRVIVLQAGAVLQAGTVAEVTQRPRSGFVADLLGVNLLRGVARRGEVTLENGAQIATGDRADGEVFLLIRAASIALYRTRPEGSPRNVFAGVVQSIERQSERCRVRVAGVVPLVAEVTAGALDELDLVDGAAVWASFKAMEVVSYAI